MMLFSFLHKLERRFSLVMLTNEIKMSGIGLVYNLTKNKISEKFEYLSLSKYNCRYVVM